MGDAKPCSELNIEAYDDTARTGMTLVALLKFLRTDRIGVRDTEVTVSTRTALFSPSEF